MESPKPASSAWDAYLQTYHRELPNATADSLEAFLTGDGETSYRLLAATLDEKFARGADLHVLDLGCGDGRLTREIIGMRGASVTPYGLDLSVDEIARAHERGLTETFVAGNAQAMPFAPGRFDAVLSHFAFMLMVPIDAVICEIERVLAPDGFFAAAISRLSEAHGDMGELLTLFRKANGGNRHPAIPQFDPRQSNSAGIAELFAGAGSTRTMSIRHEEVTARVDAAGAYDYLAKLYFFEALGDDARRSLRSDIDRLTADRGGQLSLAKTVDIVALH